MPIRKSDPERDERITMEVVVDCYNEAEVMLGWYYYLENHLEFPFTAKCVKKQSSSPLKVGQHCTIRGLASEEECIDEDGILVLLEFNREELAVPLTQLLPAQEVKPEMLQAIEDWHYWTGN